MPGRACDEVHMHVAGRAAFNSRGKTVADRDVVLIGALLSRRGLKKWHKTGRRMFHQVLPHARQVQQDLDAAVGEMGCRADPAASKIAGVASAPVERMM